MKRSTWSAYRVSDGEFTGLQLSGTRAFAEANLGPGEAVVEGAHCSVTTRVSNETGEVVRWREPRPSPAHAWDGAAWRIPPVEAIARLRAQILELEAEQARPLREIAIARAHGEAAPTGAVDRLLQIEQRAAALRAEISKHKENP